VEIAGTCFRYSRFHLDPRVPREIADRIKREWIRNYATKRRGERLLVASLEGRPAGFLAVLASESGGQRIRTIDLVGVAAWAQRRGVGRALVEAFIAASRGVCDVMQVGTQAANIPSMRLYETTGFCMSRSQYVLHGHVPADQAR
jgi:ribosomal protein S18 acetylase RimI-like enzyme